MTDNATIYLCKADNSLLGVIEGIDPQTCRLTRNAAELWELTFDVGKYQNGEDGLRQSSYYDSLDDMMKLYLDSRDTQAFFVIDEEPVTKGDAYQEIKTVTAHSIECELNHVYLKNFKINCGTHDSQEYLATDADNNTYNVDAYTTLPYTYIPLVNYDDPRLSLLHLALQETGWSVQEGIDPEICGVKLSFDTSDSVYSFLMKTVSPKASVLFTFDRKHRRVGMVRAADYGEDTGVFVSMRNLMNNFTVTGSSNDSIRTKLIPTGANGLGIEYVNFGQNYLINLDYFMETTDEYGDCQYVSAKLRDKYRDWKAYRETDLIDYEGKSYTRRELYRELSKEYNQTLADISEIRTRLPNDGCLIDYSTYTAEELQTAYTAYNNAFLALMTLYRKEYGGETPGDAPDYLPTPATAVCIKDTPYWQDFYAYQEVILPQIEEACKMYYQTNEDGTLNSDGKGHLIKLPGGNPDYYANESIVKKADAYLYEWSLYGLDELISKKKAWTEAAQLLFHKCFILSGTPSKPVKYRTPDADGYNTLPDHQKSAFTSQDAFIRQLSQYLDYMALEERENSLTHTVGKGIIRQCEAAIDERTQVLTDLEANLETLASKRSELAKSVTLEHFAKDGVPVFTDKDLAVIHSMLREQEYSNDHIFTTSLDDARSTVEVQEKLYQAASEELYQLSRPQYSFQTELDNLYCLEEFQAIRKPFDIGNFIRVGFAIHEEMEENRFVKLRLISITHNPLAMAETISITFSTMTKSLNGISDLAFLLDGSSASGISSSAGGSPSGSSSGGTYGTNEANVQISNNMLNALLHTELFGTAVTDVMLDTMKANKGNFNTLFSHSGVFDSLEAGQIKVSGDCLFDKIRSDNYNANLGIGSSFDLANGTFESYSADGKNYIKNDGEQLSIKMNNFSVDRNGKASFKGDISGSNGTFSGTLNSCDGNFTGTLNGCDGNFTGTLSGCDGHFTGSIKVNDKFEVDSQGNLSAKNAKIDGEIHATNSIISESTFSGDIEAEKLVVNQGGSIAGWQFNANAFYKNKPQLGSADGAYLGENGISVRDHFIADENGIIATSKGGFDYCYDSDLDAVPPPYMGSHILPVETELPGTVADEHTTVKVTLNHVNIGDKICLGVVYYYSDSLFSTSFFPSGTKEYLIDVSAEMESCPLTAAFDTVRNVLELTIFGNEIKEYHASKYVSFYGIRTYEEADYHTAEIKAIEITNGTTQEQYTGRILSRSGLSMNTGAQKIEGDLFELNGKKITGYEDFEYCIRSSEYPDLPGTLIPVTGPGSSQELFDNTYEIFKVGKSELFHAGLSTSSSGSNLIISSGSFHRKSSSSQRYKNSIEKLSTKVTSHPSLDPERLYDLDVVSFRYNDDYLPQTDQRYQADVPGLIAEDVYAKYPIACNLDREGRPEMWDVNILFPAALKLIQDMHTEIEQLKQRVDRLSSQ